MAKILIPFSGGWNSTYTLIDALDNTTHEIVVCFYDFSYWISPTGALTPMGAGVKLEWNAAQAIVFWLQEQGKRPFQFVTRPMGWTDENGQEIIQSGWHPNMEARRNGRTPNAMIPIRQGFSHQMDGAFVKARYCEHARAAAELGCDEVWISLDNYNTHTDQHIYFTQNLLAINPSVKVVVPSYIWNDPADTNLQPPDSFTIKRYSMFEALPAEVKALTSDGFGMREFYNNVIVPDEDPTDLWDDWAEFVGGFGESRDIADPATYVFNDNIKHSTNPSFYGRFLGQRPDNPTRRGIDKVAEAQRWTSIRKSDKPGRPNA